MRTATLTSQPSTDDGTFGKLVTDTGKVFYTGENIWANNIPGVSCILPEPGGTANYLCKWTNSPKHGWCYLITNTPGRTMCEIHSANFMGDPNKGLVDQLLGCVALGMSIGELVPAPNRAAQMAVLQSKDAIAAFDAEMAQEDFMLTIIRSK